MWHTSVTHQNVKMWCTSITCQMWHPTHTRKTQKMWLTSATFVKMWRTYVTFEVLHPFVTFLFWWLNATPTIHHATPSERHFETPVYQALFQDRLSIKYLLFFKPVQYTNMTKDISPKCLPNERIQFSWSVESKTNFGNILNVTKFIIKSIHYHYKITKCGYWTPGLLCTSFCQDIL